MKRWLRSLRLLFLSTGPESDRQEKDLKDEIAFHLAKEAADRMAAGQSQAEAVAAAKRDFGNVALVEDVTRHMWGWRVGRDRLLQDVRYAVRALMRDPSFTIVALATLVLGIAATVSVFAVTKAVLLNPLPFPDPDRLVMVWERTPAGAERNFTSAFNFIRWHSRNQVFVSLGAITQLPVNVSGLGDAEQVDGLAVTSGFFDALAVAPLMGRTIGPSEDSVFPPRSVVLSYQFWRQRYGGAPDVVGRLLILNGAEFEIVGVMPSGFAFPAARAAELYVPMPMDPAAPFGGRSLITVARLETGVTLDAARADMQRVVAQLGEEAPRFNAGWGASVFPLFEETVGSVRRILWVILASVACLLLLACLNVANLLLIRAAKRRHEFAVRAALGAGRWRLVHQLAAESLVLTLVAGAAGLAIATIIVPAIPSMFPPTFPLPRATEISIDGSVVLLTILVCGTVGLVFSLLPMVRAAQDRLAQSLRAGGRSAFASHSRLRRALVTLEVAIALVLVFAAALMGSSLLELSTVNPGFQAERVLSLRMLMLPRRYGDPAQRVSFLQNVLEEIRATPGVTNAASIHFLPLSGVASGAPVFRKDRPEPSREQLHGGPVSVVTPGYFAAMGIPLRGRDFSTGDRLDTPGVVIVNESLAREMFPGEDPIGKHVKALYSPATEDLEIVGIAGDIRTSTLDKEPGPAIYIAHNQEPSLFASLVVRTQAPPASAAAAVRAAIARVDPEQGVSQVQPLATLIANATARPRVQASVFGAFGLLALLIAGVGLYGVMAYGVEQRRRELGLQLALGAAPTRLLRTVVFEGVSLAAIGASFGAALAWFSSTSLEGLLYATRPSDPTILLGVGATLIVVACLATLAPALRATRVDPLVVLRAE